MTGSTIPPDDGLLRGSDGEDPGMADLAARLDAYVAARLTPDPAVMAAMRDRIVEAAARSSALGAGNRASPRRWQRTGSGAARRLALPALFLRRPALVVLVLVTVVVAGTGAAFAASAPGGLLYPVRLWAETLTLPNDPAARTDAELARLGARVGDAASAAATGDARGVAAAVDAYATELADAEAAAGGDPTRRADVAREISRHRDTLLAAIGRVPPRADPAIAAALARTSAHIDAILGSGQPGNGQPGNGQPGNGQPGGPPGSGQPGNGQPGGPPARGASPTPTAAPTALPSPAPTATPSGAHPGVGPSPSAGPRSSPTPKPAGTPPGSTPRPHPTRRPHPTPHPHPTPPPRPTPPPHPAPPGSNPSTPPTPGR